MMCMSDRGDSRGYTASGATMSRATVSRGTPSGATLGQRGYGERGYLRRAGLRQAGLRRAGLRRAGLYGEQGYGEQGYGEHYAGYGVDEEVLEAAYDAGRIRQAVRGLYGGEPAYDSEPCDKHFDGSGVTYTSTEAATCMKHVVD